MSDPREPRFHPGPDAEVPDPTTTYGDTPGGNRQPPYRGPGDDELPMPVPTSPDRSTS